MATQYNEKEDVFEEVDATTHLNKSPANSERLETAIAETSKKKPTRKPAVRVARLAIRLDPIDLQDFQNYADSMDLSVSYLIRKYIKDTLKGLDKQRRLEI
jgi:hypothetical protein